MHRLILCMIISYILLFVYFGISKKAKEKKVIKYEEKRDDKGNGVE